jgi:predicted TIM-barrel fold metal-dependent hydrolase
MSKTPIVGRREFLKTAGGGLATLAVARTEAGAAPAGRQAVPERLRIDVHGHYFPTDYLDMLDRFGGGGTGTGSARAVPADGSPAELASRFAMMDRAGMQMQVLSAAPQLPYFEDQDQAVTAAQFINDAYAEMVERHPERFAAYAVTPLPHVDASIEEMGRALDTLGMVGITMGTSVMETSVADPMFDPFWAELDRRGAILFLHPSGLGACSPLVQGGLTWPIGATIEDTMVVAHLTAQAIPLRYPRVRIIVPHLGGETSMLIRRLDNQKGMFLPADAEAPSVTARRLWYDTVAHGYAPALQMAVDAFGADRMVLGTDFPYLIGDVFQDAVDYIARALPAEQAEAIQDRNAQALFRLNPPA